MEEIQIQFVLIHPSTTSGAARTTLAATTVTPTTSLTMLTTCPLLSRYNRKQIDNAN